MRLAKLVREAVDQRVRPAQRGGTTVAGSLPDDGLAKSSRCVFLAREGVEAGRYGRSRYGQGAYAARGW